MGIMIEQDFINEIDNKKNEEKIFMFVCLYLYRFAHADERGVYEGRDLGSPLIGRCE